MDFGERITVSLRAQLLDAVIDTVADDVEARIVPTRMTEIQDVKKREQETALELYQRLWSRTIR
jgi:hypothetical protein